LNKKITIYNFYNFIFPDYLRKIIQFIEIMNKIILKNIS